MTERDVDVLYAVGRAKYLTTALVRQLFFGDRSTCTRRLAKLVALGLLNVFVLELNFENLYGLSERGRDLLLTHGVEEGDLHVGRAPARSGIEHNVAINELRVALVLACRAHPDLTLDLFLSDHDLRRVRGFDVAPYHPDALVRIGTPQGERGLVVEMDAGTESPRYFAAHKGRTLLRLARAGERCWGLSSWRPVLLTFGADRLRVLTKPLVAEGGGELWLGGSLMHLREAGPFGAAFAMAAEITATPRGTPIRFERSLLDVQPRVS